MDAAVRVDGLSVRAGDRPVLDRVDLVAGPGELVVVAGPSGGGKSTLLRALAGHTASGLSKVAGEVSVLGVDPFTLPARELRRLRRTGVAVVGQDPMSSFQPRHSVRAILAEVCPAAQRDALVAALELAGLPGAEAKLRRRPAELSGGELRRVALARALIREPSVLAVDEPTSGLDPSAARAIAALLVTVAHERRMMVVVATHDAQLARVAADRCVLLDGGRARSGAVAPRRALVARAPSARRGAPGGPPALRATGLRVRVPAARGSVEVVHGVDLAVEPGRVLGVVGPSGAGKTSVLRLLAGLAHGDGDVRLAGEPLALQARRRSREQRAAIQLVGQDPLGALNPARTIGSTLMRPLRRHHGLGRAQARRAAERLLGEVDLDTALLERRPAELSGGQRQRVALARALAARPRVLLCDEITSALDGRSATAVLTALLSARDRHGLAVVLVTHDHDLAREVADEVVLIEGGRATARGLPAEVLEDAMAAEPLEAAVTR